MPGVLVAVLFLGAVAAVATMTGAPYIMFPELAALSYGVFLRPNGEWARSPLLLAMTPVATAILGVLVTRTMPYALARRFNPIKADYRSNDSNCPEQLLLVAGFCALYCGHVCSWLSV